MDYFYTFYCDEIAMDLDCELEFEEPEPEVGLDASMTLVSATPSKAPLCDIFAVLRQDLVDEIEQAALGEAMKRHGSRPVDSDYV